MTTDEEYDYISKMIGALSRMDTARDDRRSVSPGLWLMTVRSIAWALIIEASAQHVLWEQDMGDMGLIPSAHDADVIAEVRRMVLGEDVPVAPIALSEVLARMGLLAFTDLGGGGS